MKLSSQTIAVSIALAVSATEGRVDGPSNNSVRMRKTNKRNLIKIESVEDSSQEKIMRIDDAELEQVLIEQEHRLLMSMSMSMDMVGASTTTLGFGASTTTLGFGASTTTLGFEGPGDSITDDDVVLHYGDGGGNGGGGNGGGGNGGGGNGGGGNTNTLGAPVSEDETSSSGGGGGSNSRESDDDSSSSGGGGSSSSSDAAPGDTITDDDVVANYGDDKTDPPTLAPTPPPTNITEPVISEAPSDAIITEVPTNASEAPTDAPSSSSRRNVAFAATITIALTIVPYFL